MTREIFWNIGRGVMAPMYLLSLLAVAACAYGFYRRVRVYRQGKPLVRWDHVTTRLRRLVKGLSQGEVLRVPAPGLPHSLFFWGFLLLFIGTVLIALQVDFLEPLFKVTFLQGVFYEVYSLVLDLAGLTAVLMLLGLGARRFFYRPKGLKITRDDYLVYALLLAIIFTGFFIEGARMAVTEIKANPALARWSPVGLVVARAVGGLGENELRTLHRVGWWLHFVLAMTFIVAIPFTKLRHLFTTPINYFFADLRPKGAIQTINLEAEGAEHFGVAEVADLTWKDIFDADACTACKRCQDRCPAWQTEKPLSPMLVVQQLGQAAFARSTASLIETVTADAIWACTTCRACQEICPAQIEQVNKIIEMRRNLVLMRGEFPGEEVMTAANNVEVNGNPFGLAYADRGDWAHGTGTRLLADGEPVDILYFTGCYAAFDKRNQAVARSFIRLCQAAGVRVGLLGKEEKCCGEPLRKLGNEYLYQQVARENIARIKAYGVSKIVTTCPHCFNTLSRDYADLGLTVPVEHSTQFLDRLIAQGALPLRPQPFTFTYHDSCNLARYRDIVREPRRMLAAAGGKLQEMDRSGYDSFCCGAGGGRILAEEKLGRRINVDRVKMAQASGAPLLVSSCPFCLTMFEDGIKAVDGEGQLQARDATELLAERLAPGPG